MAERKSFLLRLTPEVFEALRGWADDELRSVNAQIEFLLVRALRDAGRAPKGRRGGSASEEIPEDAKGD
ncbi:MAG TPA: hypothetical protein VE685_02205 [Thermoanaerobaculia bacterium]|nr:hypothetical protein [Thermoanaerobaculia bacterium]